MSDETFALLDMAGFFVPVLLIAIWELYSVSTKLKGN